MTDVWSEDGEKKELW